MDFSYRNIPMRLEYCRLRGFRLMEIQTTKSSRYK